MESYMYQSCLALQAVGQSVQSLLGPNKMLKCYIASSPEDSSILVDTMQVLDAFMSSYHHKDSSSSAQHQDCSARHGPPPALQFLYEACLEQKRKVGCGMTTLVCLSAYWAPEILSLARQNIPLYFVFGIFYDALEKCKDHMKSLKLDIGVTIRPSSLRSTYGSHVSAHDSHMTCSNTEESKRTLRHCSDNQLGKVASPRRRDRVLSYSRHFSKSCETTEGEHKARASKEVMKSETNARGVVLNEAVCMRLSGGRKEAMRLAMEVWHMVDGSPGALTKLPLEYNMIGKSKHSSAVLKGVVMNLQPSMCNIAQSLLGAPHNMIIFESDCVPGHRHLGLRQDYGHVMSHDTSQLHQTSRDKKWLESALSVIEELDVKILVSGGAVSPLLWEQCIGRDLLVIKNIPARIRAALSDLTGARSVNYFSQCSKEVLGVGVKAEVLEAGWARPAADVSQFKTRSSRQPIRTHCCRLYQDSLSSDVATVLLCGLSEVEVDNFHHQLQNCWHRLRWATTLFHTQLLSQPHLLPGGGVAEASCIAFLEHMATGKEEEKEKSSQLVENNLPLYFTTQREDVMNSTSTNQWRLSVYEAFTNGLRQLLCRIVLNSRPGMKSFQALSEVNCMIGGESERCETIDMGVVKMEVWSRAVWLLERIFMSNYKKN